CDRHGAHGSPGRGHCGSSVRFRFVNRGHSARESQSRAPNGTCDGKPDALVSGWEGPTAALHDLVWLWAGLRLAFAASPLLAYREWRANNALERHACAKNDAPPMRYPGKSAIGRRGKIPFCSCRTEFRLAERGARWPARRSEGKTGSPGLRYQKAFRKFKC